MQTCYNIAIAPNGVYVNYSIVLLQSLFDNNQGKNFRIFVMYYSLKDEEKEKLNEFVQAHGATIDFIYIDGEKYKKVFEWNERFSVEAYFRLEIQDVFPRNLDRVLYLDGDMIVNGDIDELYQTDLDGKYLAACGFSPRCECGDEFNSGMLLFDMEKMRKDITFETYVKLSERLHGDYYQDQGLLNAQFAEHGTKYVWKQKYNFTCAFYRKYQDAVQKELPGFTVDDAVVLHYPGPGIRPWQAAFSREEYEQLRDNGVLELLAMQGFIVDDLYMKLLTIWWDYAKKTPVYEELQSDMYRMKSELLEKTLLATVHTTSYKIGRKIVRLIKR